MTEHEIVTLCLINLASLLEGCGHQWTAQERELFDQAVDVLRRQAMAEEAKIDRGRETGDRDQGSDQ